MCPSQLNHNLLISNCKIVTIIIIIIIIIISIINRLCLTKVALDSFPTDKSVALGFRIKLEFRNVGFCGEGETGVPGEKPRNKRTNNTDDCSHHCATHPPHLITIIISFKIHNENILAVLLLSLDHYYGYNNYYNILNLLGTSCAYANPYCIRCCRSLFHGLQENDKDINGHLNEFTL